MFQLKEDLAGQEAEDEGREEEEPQEEEPQDEEPQEEAFSLHSRTQEEKHSMCVTHIHTPPRLRSSSADTCCLSAAGSQARSRPKTDQSRGCRR